MTDEEYQAAAEYYRLKWEADPGPHDVAPRKRGEGYIYFIKSPALNAVKVGYTAKHPRRRLRTMQTGNADELRLLGWTYGTPETEAGFHRWFAEYCARGEWFKLEDDFADFVNCFLKYYWSSLGKSHEAEAA